MSPSPGSKGVERSGVAHGPLKAASVGPARANPAKSTAHPSSPTKPLDRSQLLAPLQGEIRKVRVGMGYRLGLGLVAMMMLILPLIYFALIGLLCYGLYWHLRMDSILMEERYVRGAIVLYLGPIIIGGVLLLFMVKPLLARRADDSVPLSLRREDEPLLFEFIHRLCRLLGAPVPSRVDVTLEVNAAASFRRGWRGVLGRDLVLTVGLPLAAGLDARAFAGVLAHEMGHFAQGSAMRLSYVIRSIDAWFFRIVYQRDAWDAMLIVAARRRNHAGVMVIAQICRLCIWLTRRVLWGLMWVGHAASSMLQRQMEFDADRYECRIAGSDAFARTAERLIYLNVASMVAFSDLTRAWREKRLCDNLPALIRSRELDLPPDARQKLLATHSQRKTRWFDSHPSDERRITAAKLENENGLFQVDAPATVLFSDFAGLSRIATMVYYKKQIGPAFKPELLIKTAAVVKTNVGLRETRSALARYFRGLVDAARPTFASPPAAPPADRAAAAERLLVLRSQLMELEPLARHAVGLYSTAHERAALLALVRELRTAGFRKSGAKDPSFDAMNDSVLRAQEAAARADREAARATIDQALAIATERLDLALQPAPPPLPDALELVPEDDYGEYDLADESPKGCGDPLLDALLALRLVQDDMQLLRQHAAALNVLMSRAKPLDNPKPLVDAVVWHSRKASGLLRDMFRNLGSVKYPYAETGRSIPLNSYIIPALPGQEEIGSIGATSSSAIDAYHSLYMRLMSDLANRAEQIETDLGLPMMDEPAEIAAVDA